MASCCRCVFVRRAADRRPGASHSRRRRRERPRSSVRCTPTTRPTSRGSARGAGWRSSRRRRSTCAITSSSSRPTPEGRHAQGRRRRGASRLCILRRGEPITNFEVVHEKQYHLFVISQDMAHFQHIHPALQPDGTWTIDVTLPKAGYYTVLSDFLPRGGAWQFLARPLVTAGYTGDLAADSVQLVPDTNLTKDVDDLPATRLIRSADVCRRPVRASELSPHRHDDRPACHRPADLPWSVRAHAHHERGPDEYVHSHPLDIVPGTDDDGEPAVRRFRQERISRNCAADPT